MCSTRNRAVRIAVLTPEDIVADRKTAKQYGGVSAKLCAPYEYHLMKKNMTLIWGGGGGPGWKSGCRVDVVAYEL